LQFLRLKASADGIGVGSVCRESRPETIAAAIGPEGGFTEAEAAVAVEAGFRAVRSGDSILRVETAAVVAAALFVSFVGGLD
jgi:16S rRNA (uracil1498-N3)-methyltransferase